MALTDLANVTQFEEYVKSKELSIVHFCAAWAAQCTQMNEVLEEMTKSNDYKGAKFAKITAEDVPEISLKYGVSAVPTVLLIRNGVVAERVDGANPGALAEKIKEELNSGNSVTVDIRNLEISLEERLKKLINKAPCVLFMKGDPSNPRCGFSRTIVSILEGYKADYQSFDILQDNAVREGLKKFSNWPTYPQLYVDGELLGGLDIVKEMSESGELESVLPKKNSPEERS